MITSTRQTIQDRPIAFWTVSQGMIIADMPESSSVDGFLLSLSYILALEDEG